MRFSFQKWGLLSAILWSIFLPFPKISTEYFLHTQLLFSPIIKLLAKWFALPITTFNFSSDSLSFFWLMYVIGVVAFLGSFILPTSQKFSKYGLEWLSIYAGLVWLVYGFDKVTLQQFPSPNVQLLSTPLGSLTPDIVFWSLIRSTPLLQFFLGMVECLLAVLLIFKKYRYVGIAFAIPVLVLIFIINLAFDISVKGFVGYLLFIHILLIINQKPYFSFRKSVWLQKPDSRIALGLKSAMISLILLILGRNYYHIQTQMPGEMAWEIINVQSKNSDTPNLKWINILPEGVLVLMENENEKVIYQYSQQQNKYFLKNKIQHTSLEIQYLDAENAKIYFENGVYLAKKIHKESFPLLNHPSNRFFQ